MTPRADVIVPRPTFAMLEPISPEQRTSMTWALRALRDARMRQRSLTLLDGERGAGAYSNVIEALGWIATLDDRLTWHHGSAYLRARNADRRGRVVAALKLLCHRLPAEVPLAIRLGGPDAGDDTVGHGGPVTGVGGGWVWRPLEALPPAEVGDATAAVRTYRGDVAGEIIDRPVYRGELWFASLARARCSVLTDDITEIEAGRPNRIPRPRLS